jgi:hypothetical protein
LPRWPHQHRSTLTPGGKLAFFDFFGLQSLLEQGTLMVKFHRRKEEKQLVHQNKAMPDFIERGDEKWRERICRNRYRDKIAGESGKKKYKQSVAKAIVGWII